MSEDLSYKPLRADSLIEGELGEMIDFEMKRIEQNIADPNSEVKFKRELNIKLSFVPTKEDNLFMMVAEVKPKLAPVRGFAKPISVSRTGKMYKSVAKQDDLFDKIEKDERRGNVRVLGTGTDGETLEDLEGDQGDDRQ